MCPLGPNIAKKTSLFSFFVPKLQMRKQNHRSLSGHTPAVCSVDWHWLHLFFFFGCSSSADLYRRLFSLPFVVDLGGSLGTKSSEACTGDASSNGAVGPSRSPV